MDYQKGVSLVIVFLVMTIMLSSVLGLTTILSNKIKVLQNSGNSLSSLYSAESGIEETLYLDRKKIPQNASRGFCNICNSCENCSNCTTTALALGGCNLITCNNCQVKYDFTFNNIKYAVDAKTTPSLFFSCTVKGSYSDTTKTIKVISTSISSLPQEQ